MKRERGGLETEQKLRMIGQTGKGFLRRGSTGRCVVLRGEKRLDSEQERDYTKCTKSGGHDPPLLVPPVQKMAKKVEAAPHHSARADPAVLPEYGPDE